MNKYTERSTIAAVELQGDAIPVWWTEIRKTPTGAQGIVGKVINECARQFAEDGIISGVPGFPVGLLR